MRYFIFLFITFFSIQGFSQDPIRIVPLDSQTGDSITIRSIFTEALTHGNSYNQLKYLCKVIGNRLSGSPAASEAVSWGESELKKMALDRVYLQSITVPYWVRGNKEWAAISEDFDIPINICALGGSVGTNGPLISEVIEVQNFKELEALGREKINGKIVFYNRPMDKSKISTFEAYGGCVNQRYGGASEAAKFGAVAVIVRSMTTLTDQHPHTGSMGYKEGVVKIPACAVSTGDADVLSNYIENNGSVNVVMNLNCQDNGEVQSYNVIGEIKGSEKPNEVIVVGAHLDSWDKGEGAHDDGAGIVQCMELLRIFNELKIKPKHTIRVVLYMNEENGNNGGKTYAKKALQNGEKHIAALESDRGGFTPRGFSIAGTDEQVKLAKSFRTVLEPYGLHFFERGFAGVDIAPLKYTVDSTIFLAGLTPDSQRYFDYHHSDTDVFENVNQRELELGGAAMTAFIYLLDSRL
jgi:hypothetical protein